MDRQTTVGPIDRLGRPVSLPLPSRRRFKRQIPGLGRAQVGEVDILWGLPIAEGKLHGRLIPQRAMGTFLVVELQVQLGHGSGVVAAVEGLEVQALVAQGAVEPLDVYPSRRRLTPTSWQARRAETLRRVKHATSLRRSLTSGAFFR